MRITHQIGRAEHSGITCSLAKVRYPYSGRETFQLRFYATVNARESGNMPYCFSGRDQSFRTKKLDKAIRAFLLFKNEGPLAFTNYWCSQPEWHGQERRYK